MHSHSTNRNIPGQNLPRVPRQELLSSSLPEGHIPWPGSVEEPDAQQFGVSGKGVGFSNAKFVLQGQQSFQQGPHKKPWEVVEQQLYARKELDYSGEQIMQQTAHAEFPETSYSALLHGPDTPPFHPEPAWDNLAEEGHRCAGEGISWPSKSVTVKDPSSFNGYQGAPTPFANQHFWPGHIRNKQKVSARVCQRAPEPRISNLEDAAVQEQTCPNVGLQMQHSDHSSAEKDHPSKSRNQSNSQQAFQDPRASQHHPYHEWNVGKHNAVRPLEQVNASLRNNGQSFMQSQQHTTNLGLEGEDANCNQPQSWEESVIKQQQSMALPSRAMPKGHVANGFELQQYNVWNGTHSQTMSGAYASRIQHAADTGFNRWDASAWQEGHPSLQHTPCLPYGSAYIQMGPNQAPLSWQTHAMGTMVDSYSQYYPEGYFFYDDSGARKDANFTGVGETDSVAPRLFDPYGQQYQEPQVYPPPPDQFFSRFGTPAIGAGPKTSGPPGPTSPKSYERLLNAGGQVQPRQLQSTGGKGPCASHSATTDNKSEQEKAVKYGNANEESSFCEEDLELEGPQVKRLRECSDVDAYHLNADQSSGKFSPQPHTGSALNLAENSGVEVTSSGQNLSDIQCSTNHSSIRDPRSQALSQSHGFESGTDQQGQSSDIVIRTLQRSGMPSNFSAFWTNNAVHAEIPARLMPGQMLNRTNTRSTSSVCSFENGAGPPQSDFISRVNCIPGVHLQEHGISNGFIPEGYREEFSTTRTDSTVSTAQDKASAHLLLRQFGERTQVGSPARLPTLSKASTFQQLAIPTVALENPNSEKVVSSDDATQECTMLKPRKIVEGAGYINASGLKYQDTGTEPYVYGNLGQHYSSMVERGEHVEQQRMPYPMSGTYPTHLEARVQTPEMKPFGHPKTGVLETGAHLRGFNRPALGKFYPPPPFQSNPLHLQRVRGTIMNTRAEDETFPAPEAWASGNFESAMLNSGTKETVSKPVNYQANAGYMVEGGVFYQAAAGSGMMRRGLALSESTQMHQLPASSLEAGSVNVQQPDSTSFYTHTSQTVLPKSIAGHMHSSSITVESQGSAGPNQMLRDNKIVKDSQSCGHLDPMVTNSPMHVNGDQHLSSLHSDYHPGCGEYTNLRDGEPIASGMAIFEQNPRQASKANLRSPFTTQAKKRKKSVPYLIPWHIVTAQPRGQLPSISKAELMWAAATNRFSDKDGGEVSNLGIFRAESRLRLSTQLMQQIFAPFPSVIMHGKQSFNLECGVYNLAKSALGEACRLIAGTHRETESAQKSTDIKTIRASHGQMRTWNMGKEVVMAKLVERFMERVKHLDFEVTRLDRSMSVLQLRCQSHDFERSSILQRLGRHHGPEFSINSMENRLAEAITSHGPLIRKSAPQKYVIPVPMPRTLPEGVRCLSL